MVTQLAQDGSVMWTTLAEPGRGLATAVGRRRALTVILFSTALSLLATGLILPSLDAEAVAVATLRPDMTPHERTQAIETATKLHQVTTWAAAGLTPAVNALLLAVGLWLAFWVAGARTDFKPALTVAAHALVPQALKALLTVPAAMAHAPIEPTALATLLPSNLAAVVPPSLGWPGPVMAVAAGLDLFTLWSVALAGTGMAKASGASRLRTWLVMVVLFAAYLALFKVVPSAGGLGSPGAP